MLTREDIILILDTIGRQTLVKASKKFPYYIVTEHGHGYSDDPKIGALQAKLSIMLETAR